MRRVIMYKPDHPDSDMLPLIPRDMEMDLREHKLLNKVAAMQVMTSEDAQRYIDLLRRARDTYMEYANQTLPIGGFILNAETAEAMKKNWTSIATRIDNYLTDLQAVLTFIQHTGLEEEDRETIMSDLLCDLLHLCDAEDIDFDEALRRGKGNYEEEIRDEEWESFTSED